MCPWLFAIVVSAPPPTVDDANLRLHPPSFAFGYTERVMNEQFQFSYSEIALQVAPCARAEQGLR